MSKLEEKILKGLNLIGYNGPISQVPQLQKAAEIGQKSIEYTELVQFLTNEIRTLHNIDEEVNAISTPEDSVSFVMEITSFLKELNCPYASLTQGLVSDRLQHISDRLLLLDYLLTELMGARILQEKKPEKKIELKLQETPEGADMRQILMTLCFSKPPPNISVATLFNKLGPTIQIVLEKTGVDLIGNGIFSGFLSDKQWDTLNDVQKDLNQEYKIRREMLLTRLDVTIQSFQWSDKTKGKGDLIEKIYTGKRKLLKVDPDVEISDLLAARAEIAIIEKTSNSSVRKNTQTSVNKIIIGQVPDRGGRTSEQAPPPPEMPSWQQRSAGPPSGGRGGGNYNRGGGSFSSGGNTRGNYAPRGDYNSSRGNYSNTGGYGGGNNSSFDSAGSYSVDQKYGGGSGGYAGSNSRGGYDNSANTGYDSNNYNKGRGGGNHNYDNAGGYSGNFRGRDSSGSYGKQDYEQTNKRVKTYDSFQSNKTTYADQYVQESQHNEQYHSRGYRGGGRGRSNYNRGRGQNYH